MRSYVLRIVFALMVLVGGVSRAAPPEDTPTARQQAAEHLFDLPAYRLVATRQVHEAIRSLPEEQYQSALGALSDPKIVQALRAVIVRSMAQTFTVAELESLGRYLATDAARSTVEKTDAFQAALMRELLVAALTNPDLAQILVPR
jgi:hypothetical protein